MSNREIFAWVLVGFIIGFLVALWLSPPAPVPPCPEPCAESKDVPDTEAMEAALKRVS